MHCRQDIQDLPICVSSAGSRVYTRLTLRMTTLTSSSNAYTASSAVGASSGAPNTVKPDEGVLREQIRCSSAAGLSECVPSKLTSGHPQKLQNSFVNDLSSVRRQRASQSVRQSIIDPCST